MMAQKDAEALLRDIRAHCLDCMGGSREQVAKCNCTRCSLHPHRMGAEVHLISPASPDSFPSRGSQGDGGWGLQLSLLDGGAGT